jgi:hypothetical protein
LERVLGWVRILCSDHRTVLQPNLSVKSQGVIQGVQTRTSPDNTIREQDDHPQLYISTTDLPYIATLQHHASGDDQRLVHAGDLGLKIDHFTEHLVLTNGLVDKVGGLFHRLKGSLKLAMVRMVLGRMTEKALKQHPVTRDALNW